MTRIYISAQAAPPDSAVDSDVHIGDAFVDKSSSLGLEFEPCRELLNIWPFSKLNNGVRLLRLSQLLDVSVISSAETVLTKLSVTVTGDTAPWVAALRF